MSVVQPVDQPVPEDLGSTIVTTTDHPLQDESDKNEVELQSLEHEHDGTSADDKHSVDRSQGSQTNLEPPSLTTAEMLSDDQAVSKPLVELETALTVNEERDEPSSVIDKLTKDETQITDETEEEKDSTEKTESDGEDEGALDESAKDNDTPKEVIAEVKEDHGPPLTMDRERGDQIVESSAVLNELKPADDLKPVVDEHTSAISDTESPNADQKLTTPLELDQPPESTASPKPVIDDVKTEETTSSNKSEPTVNPSLFLKPILPLHDGLTVTTSEPRLPVLPPISTTKKQGTGEMKSKSASDLKRQSTGKVSERGESNLVKNKHKCTTSRSTSGSILSRSRDMSGSSENVVKKSTSRESLRSGSHTHLKASSSLLLQKNNGGLSSKKLSLSRESLKAANLVYTSSKSRESLKSGGRLSSRSKDSLKSNKTEGGKKTKVECHVETEDTAETRKLSGSNPTPAVDSKPEQEPLQEQPALGKQSSAKYAMSAETEGQTPKKEGDHQLQDDEKKILAADRELKEVAGEHKTEIQPPEKSPAKTKESEGASEVNESAAVNNNTEQEDAANETGKSEAEGQERETTLETKFEIDHQTGQSEQSIVEAVEKSLKTKESGTSTGEPPPAVHPVTTTVQ